MKTLKICSSLLFALLISSSVFGQDSTKTFTFSGSVDTYFHSAFGTENDVYGGYAALYILR